MKDMTDILPILILIGRPASGKSEIIQYLRGFEADQRRARFHLGESIVVDDFPMLWSWFEEDKLLSQMGKPRLHTDAEGYFKHDYLWDLLVQRLGLEYEKLQTAGLQSKTVIIEFSRGSGHGGYRRAFRNLSSAILQSAAVLYVDVSFAESLRKNRSRYNPRARHSILEHSLPDEKMRRLYEQDDWSQLYDGSGFLTLKSLYIPCAVFENEEDFTTAGGEPLGRRLAPVFEQLWRNFASRR